MTDETARRYVQNVPSVAAVDDRRKLKRKRWRRSRSAATDKDVNFLRRHRFITLVIAAAALIRFGLLVRSQTHVHSDEAIIGLMAKHISEGRHFPVYMYGQPYNASAGGEAYLAAIVFKLFGVNVIALKSVIVLLSLVYLFLFYKMTETLFDKITAVFSTVAF